MSRQQAEPPGPVWTRAAEAPEGLLTPREVELHDRFIERAQAGDIDIVFFGTANFDAESADVQIASSHQA